jgi:hypothetical protein
MKRPHQANDPAEYNRRWLARVMANTRAADNGCVLWLGTLSSKGYGSTGYKGRNNSVHRIVYQIHHGVTLRSDQFVCHSCDVRHCLAIDHLWVGSPSENNTDASIKGRHYYGAKTHCPRGHEYPEPSTFLTTGKGRNCPVCARARQRIAAGWPEDMAYSLPVVPHGHRVVNGAKRHTDY